MKATLEEMSAKDILCSDLLDTDALLQLEHHVRQFLKIRQSLSVAEAVLQSGSFPDKDTRLAALYWLKGNAEQAEAHAKKAVKAKTGKCSVARMILARIAEETEDHAAALQHCEEGAKDDPNNCPLNMGRIRNLRLLGESGKALALVGELSKWFGEKPSYHYEKGRCLEAQGDYVAALAAYDKAIGLNPQHAPSIYQSAVLLDLRGDDEEAKKRYKKIGPGTPHSYVHACLNLAILYEDEGNYMDAVACCEAVLQVQPNNRQAKLFRKSAESSMSMYYSPEETKQSERLEAVLRVPVTDFELSVRSRNCLAKMNIRTLGDLVKRSESEMLAYKNFGETSLREIREMLSSRNLRLGMMREDAATRAAISRSAIRQKEDFLSKSIDELELSVRSRKCMDSLGIVTIGDLAGKTETDLDLAKNFGRVSLNEIKRKLQEHGLSLKESE